MFTRNPNPNQQVLEQQAVALPDMVSRHGSEHESVARIGEPTVALAEAYVPALKALRQQRVSTSAALIEGHAKVSALVERERFWRGMVVRDIAGFRVDDFEVIARKPSRALMYGVYLAELAREHADEVSYAEVMIADLTAHLETARPAWQAAHLERTALTRLQREVRSKGAAFAAALVGMRRVMESALGADHPDCHLLRVTRIRSASADDDDVAPATATAPQGNGVSASPSPAASPASSRDSQA